MNDGAQAEETISEDVNAIQTQEWCGNQGEVILGGGSSFLRIATLVFSFGFRALLHGKLWFYIEMGSITFLDYHFCNLGHMGWEISDDGVKM